MTRKPWAGVSIPPNTPLPQNEFFHSDSFIGGYDVRDAQEDMPAGSSPYMLDMEVTRDDRLIRAPGVKLTEFLNSPPSQLILHAGYKFNSELLLIAPPFIGIKQATLTQWYNVGLRSDAPYGFTNFAGVLLLSNGIKGLYYRKSRDTTLTLIPGAPPAFGLTVFANRVVLGGTLVGSNMDFMGLGWSDATNDYQGWDYNNGAGAESMIGSSRIADRFQAFAPIGFDTLAIVNRRSIWIGVPTGDVFEPIRFTPRIEDTGCIAAKTVAPTEFGVIFLSDDGVRVFDGNNVPVVSEQINADLLPLSDTVDYRASFDPTRKRYYLHTPDATWVFDILRRRWFRWSGVFTDSIFFPTQAPSGKTWGEMVGTWGEQSKAWWQYLTTESDGKMYFIKDSHLGQEDPASFDVMTGSLSPQWYDRRQVGENQDQLMTALGARFTFESTNDAAIEVHLPDKPNGNFELVATGTMVGGPQTRRLWVPFIHTGRGISLGIRITAGSPRIRRAGVEFQRTGLLFDAPYEVPPATVPPEPTDALLRGRLVWMDHFSAGFAQSFGASDSAQAGNLGRYTTRTSDDAFLYSLTGGRCGGGYVEALDDIRLTISPFSVDGEVLSGEATGSQNQGSIFSIHDLQGVEIEDFVVLQQFGFHSRIVILDDLTIEAQRCTNTISDTWVAYTDATSTAKVPASGIFALETQVGATPAGYRVGGFVLTNLYTDNSPATGTSAIRLIGSPTNIVSTSIPVPYTCCIPAGTRCHGWAVIEPFGSSAEWQYDLMLAAAMPIADGETDSVVGHAHSEVFHTDPDDNPQTISTDLSWGEAERWRNVVSKVHSADEAIEELTTESRLGTIGDATGRWLDGAPFLPGPETIIRNTLFDGADFYRVGLDVTIPPLEIVALGPFALVGARINQGTYDFFFGISHQKIPWMFTGPKPAVVMNYLDPIGSTHHTYTLALKAPDGSVLDGRMGQALPGTPGALGTASAWRTMARYQLNPPTLRETQVNGSPWLVGALPQVGIRVDFSKLDAIEDLDPGDRWEHLDIGQAGLDVAYRARAVPQQVVPVHAPVPDLRIASQSIPDGEISVYDGSIDFNGSNDELISGIVSRTIDWGDGSDEEVFAGGGSGNALSHTYDQQGVDYTLTLTVRNALGVEATTTLVFSPLGDINAQFEAEIDSDGDPTGKTVDFTDLSSISLGSIVSRSWDFGDGGSSTSSTPTHVYTDYGTYHVSITVTDDLGRTATDSLDIEITEPVVGGGGCGLTAAAQAATAGIQGEDYAGGNPRFPNYLSSTNLRNLVVDEVPYRALYNATLTRFSTSIRLNTTTGVFNGRPSLEFDVDGDGYGVFNSRFSDDTGAGDDSDFTHWESTSIWIRSIFKLNQDAIDLPSGGTGRGLQLAALYGRNNYNPVIFAGGHVYQDIQTRASLDAAQTRREFVDLGAVPAIAADNWVEMIIYGAGDEGAHTQRNMLWIGDACSLSGASPLGDRTNTAFGQTGHTDPSFRDIDWMFYFNAGSTLFSDPKPGGLISLVEIHRVPLLTNPFGVALV